MADNQIKSFYDLEDFSNDQFKSLTVQTLRAFLTEAKAEQKELNSEYLSGDPLCYPPDWYDQYVFPIDCIINNIQDFLDSLNADEDSDEDSDWG